MATSSYAKSLIGGVPSDIKAALGKVLEYIFDRTFQLGPIDTSKAISSATNVTGRFVKVTTSATANQEVAVAHGGLSAPMVLLQAIPPSVVNAQFVGDLKITRAADATRIYVSSASTGVVTYLYAE